MTVEDVGDLLHLSPDSVRKYERGRDPGIARIVRAKDILQCSLMSIFAGLSDDAAGTEYNVLSPRASAILRKLATDWNGDIEALVILMGMLAAMPEDKRREIYMQADLIKDSLLANKIIRPEDLPEGIDYMEQQLGGLYR